MSERTMDIFSDKIYYRFRTTDKARKTIVMFHSDKADATSRIFLLDEFYSPNPFFKHNFQSTYLLFLKQFYYDRLIVQRGSFWQF
jgi:hypothetical protein